MKTPDFLSIFTDLLILLAVLIIVLKIYGVQSDILIVAFIIVVIGYSIYLLFLYRYISQLPMRYIK